jgi:hypothetical protein
MQTTPCGTFVFFVVARVELYGFFRRMHKVLSIIALAYDILKKGYFTTIILHRLSNRRTDSYQYSLDLATSHRNEAAVVNTQPNEVNKPPTSECGDSQV